jgi:hypothetical protein
MSVKVWAPVRYRSAIDYSTESSWAEPNYLGPNGNSTVRAVLDQVGKTASLTFSVTATDVFKFPVGLSTGVTLGGDILSFMKGTIKFDISKQFGEQQGFNVSGGTSFPVGPCKDPVEEWGLSVKIRTYYKDRYESIYKDDGYDSDVVDTILNSLPANILVRTQLYSSGGNL